MKINALPTSVLWAAAALLLATAGCGQGAVDSSQAAAERVTAAKPRRGPLELYTTQPGRIEAFEESPLFSKVAGFVKEVLVDIGDRVEKGQTLVELSMPEMADDVEQKDALVVQAEAEVRQAKAAVSASLAAVDTAQSRVDLAEAGVLRADADYEKWKSENARIAELAAGGNLTKKLAEERTNQLRAAEAAQKEATAGVDAAKAALRASKANVDKANEDVIAAQARIRVAKANLAHAKTMLGYATITAPFDGVVSRRRVVTGDFVQPASGGGAQPLLVVVRTDKVRIFVDVPEEEASLVDGGDEGDTATVAIQALGGREFDGKVTRTSWSLSAINHALRAEVDIDNPQGVLRPGMYAEAKILLAQRSDVLVLPVTALVGEGHNTYCFCVEAGKAQKRQIELGLRSGDEVEILSGVGESETVVLARAEYLKPGQAVEVIAPEKTAEKK